jgi:hypothetical protein
MQVPWLPDKQTSTIKNQSSFPRLSTAELVKRESILLLIRISKSTMDDQLRC